VAKRERKWRRIKDYLSCIKLLLKLSAKSVKDPTIRSFLKDMMKNEAGFKEKCGMLQLFWKMFYNDLKKKKI